MNWSVKIWGSKNAVLPIMAASLLIKWKIVLNNVPEIADVFTYIDILSWVWVRVEFNNNILSLDSTDLKEANFDLEKIKKIRVSILLLAPLLNRIWKVSIPTPWWCNLWARSIHSHLEWLKDIWYKYESRDDWIYLQWKAISWDIEINAGFWVTPTENLIVANVLRPWITTISQAAIEPHVMNLIDFMRLAWADISIRYDHSIVIKWVNNLSSNFECNIISDYIQSGTYMIIAAVASEKSLIIENARIKDLCSFIYKLKQSWVKVEDLWWDKVKVYRAKEIKNVDIQTNIFPWFPTDLQSPFAVLMSQAKWKSHIHEILFEWRLGWLIELEKMWCKIDILNHHEALISWKSILEWSTVASWDLRAWAAMIIAGIIANWETTITNVDYIHRWYENIITTLQSIGADIEEV